MCQRWIIALRMGKEPEEDARVCGEHFTAEDFISESHAILNIAVHIISTVINELPYQQKYN